MSEIYCAKVGLEHTFTVTNTADETLIKKQPARTCEAVNGEIEKWASSGDYISAYSREEMISIHYKQVDIEGVEEENNAAIMSNLFYLGTLPKVHNKVYDMADQPFTLRSGEIAVGSAWQEIADVKIGDTLSLTTDMGNTYAFKVKYIFKDVLFPIGNLKHGRRFFISEYDLGMPKHDIKEAFMMQDIMAYVLVLTSAFLILIILLTIRFTIKVSLIEDEKEIGMMGAIGLPAFQFKGLYIASYLFLSVIGGALGLIVRLPLSRYVTEYFAFNSILPVGSTGTLLGIGSVILMSGFIILKTLSKLMRTH